MTSLCLSWFRCQGTTSQITTPIQGHTQPVSQTEWPLIHRLYQSLLEEHLNHPAMAILYFSIKADKINSQVNRFKELGRRISPYPQLAPPRNADNTKLGPHSFGDVRPSSVGHRRQPSRVVFCRSPPVCTYGDIRLW